VIIIVITTLTSSTNNLHSKESSTYWSQLQLSNLYRKLVSQISIALKLRLAIKMFVFTPGFTTRKGMLSFFLLSLGLLLTCQLVAAVSFIAIHHIPTTTPTEELYRLLVLLVVMFCVCGCFLFCCCDGESSFLTQGQKDDDYKNMRMNQGGRGFLEIQNGSQDR
jgi:hypothetical protein